MNLIRIQYFLTLCESLHFTNAARSLGISQPALTKAISQLEDELGTRLIRREGKSTHLTPNGVATRKKYIALMQSVYETEKDVRNMIHGADCLMRVAITRSIDFSKIALFLAEFHRKQPTTQFDIVDCHVRQCEDLLLNGEVDCVLTLECDEIQQRFTCIELYKDSISLTQASGKELSQPDAEELKDAISGGESIDLVSRVYTNANSTENYIVSCTQELWIQQLVKAGIGFGLAASDNDTINGVNVSTNPYFKFKRQIYAALPVGRNDSSAFNNFVCFLKQYRW